MILCPQCNTQNEAGAAFCDQCGAALASAPADSAEATACPVCGAAAMAGDAFCNECGAALSAPAPAPAPASAPAPALASIPAGRAAQIVSGGGRVELSGKASYLIGREDPISGIHPEIDTTGSDGDAAGVSRRHAEIIQAGGGWFLQDLNSTNGSFVNNQRVPPHTRHPLHSGDQIRLGKWVATFQAN